MINIDPDLKQGMDYVREGKKIDEGLRLINRSARKGNTKGKSYFEVGRIIREGVPGLAADVEEARKYYDGAMRKFAEQDDFDSLDYREMGDYYFYGLGTEAININRALDYYQKAMMDGDEVAALKVKEIEKLSQTGNSSSAPSLSPETEMKETLPEEKEEPKEEEPKEEAKPEETKPVAAAEVKPEEKPEENEACKEAAPAPLQEEKAEEKKPIVIPVPVVAPVVSSEAKPVSTDNPEVNALIDADQMLIAALRILDSDSASKTDKEDAVEMVKASAEEGSLRANVLMGYLYEGDTDLLEGNYEESRKYYQAAMDKGSSTASYRLGRLYLEADAPYFDEEKGHELILDSARKGYPFALAYLGDCFRSKTADARNLDFAYQYYALAGERGLGLGYHNMGEIDASRQEAGLAKEHEKMAMENGYDPEIGHQDPLFASLHI